LGFIQALKAIRLISKLEGGSVRERSDTMHKIASLGPDAVKPLIRALKNEDLRVVHESINALGLIGHESALEHLAPFTKDYDENISKAAKRAIQRIMNNSGKPHFEKDKTIH